MRGLLRLYVDCQVAILHKERSFIGAVVGDGGLKRDRELMTGLGVGEGVDSTK